MNYTKALNNKIFQVISQASEELNVDSYVIGGFVRFDIKRDFKKRYRYCCCRQRIELALKVSALLLKTKSSDFQKLWYSDVAF
jgi:tRNA nucleotidyltransferase (CCA-adding enzyme)